MVITMAVHAMLIRPTREWSWPFSTFHGLVVGGIVRQIRLVCLYPNSKRVNVFEVNRWVSQDQHTALPSLPQVKQVH
jgi:hypothetical protein